MGAYRELSAPTRIREWRNSHLDTVGVFCLGLLFFGGAATLYRLFIQRLLSMLLHFSLWNIGSSLGLQPSTARPNDLTYALIVLHSLNRTLRIDLYLISNQPIPHGIFRLALTQGMEFCFNRRASQEISQSDWFVALDTDPNEFWTISIGFEDETANQG